jgi:hypothetical protein
MRRVLALLAAANVALLIATGIALSLVMAQPASATKPRLQVMTGTIEYVSSGFSCGTAGRSGVLGMDVVTGLGSFGSDTVLTGINSFGSEIVRDVRVSSWSDSLTVTRGGLTKSSLEKKNLKTCTATVVTGVTLR